MLEKTRQRFINSLSNDLNISTALSALFEMVRKVNILISKEKVYKQEAEEIISLLQFVDKILGVFPSEKEKELPAKIQEKIEEREKARQDKNYKLADRIRDELLKEGFILEDTKNGVRWKRIKK